MKHKGLGFVLGVSLLISSSHGAEASGSKTVNRDVANTIKTIHEKELSSKMVVSFELWLNRKAANTKKTVYENELSDRTVIADEKGEDKEVTE